MTGLYYLLPPPLQVQTIVIFLPQIIAYIALVVWLTQNADGRTRLGLSARLDQALRSGLPTGVLLGVLNVSTILFVAPRLGSDISFLRETPHAWMPPWLMLPWVIVCIAVLIELNFRGFLLGRFLALWQSLPLRGYDRVGQILATIASSVVFAFDPFMVTTFKELHWIAVWDGMVWSWLWIRARNLYAPMVAHAVEVMILYAVLKAALRS
jgi:membrane protease YdiL (CAAX protease family)